MICLCKEGDLPYMEGTTSHVLIGGVCHSYGSGLPLAQRHIKKGARWDTGTNVHRIPQIIASRSDPEGVEARGIAHYATAIVVSFTPTPTTTTAAAMSSFFVGSIYL
jgi:hypothetical protein